ncbi:50S ribosomal protein L15 [Patescibacteria group bacterium]|nr:50S ribosomal protein L15 [Patescibacteria group bacterium]
MAIGLENLTRTKGTKKTKQRRGRGFSSGSGKYSGRGMKGQRSRSGGKGGLKLRGLKTFLSNVPKKGGFRSLNTPLVTVNLEDLEKHFEDGAVVTYKELLKQKIISEHRPGIKILGKGKLTKKFKVTVNAYSKTAKDAIIKAGGKAEIKAKKKTQPKVKKPIKGKKSNKK